MLTFRRLAVRFATWPILLAWLVLIFALSSIPNELAPSSHTLPIDKVAHFIEYAVLAFLLVGVGRRVAPDRRATPAIVVAAIALSVAYGITDEWHQGFVPGRDPSLTDLAADAVGAIAGALIALVVFHDPERT